MTIILGVAVILLTIITFDQQRQISTLRDGLIQLAQYTDHYIATGSAR
jgi:hypothetical protein